MKTGYYPGCSLKGTGKEFELSLMAVLKELEYPITEIDDWCCCGASSGHATYHLLSLALPAQNILLAEQQGFTELVAPCAACYGRLVSTQRAIKKNPADKKEIEEVLEAEVKADLEVLNIIHLLQKIDPDKIKEHVKNDLSWLKVACYYGCLLVRPNNGSDDTEWPTSMEDIITSIGAVPVEWNFKVDCCGATHAFSHLNIVETLSKKILDDAMAHGADMIVVGCPLCHNNLDMRQLNIKSHHKDQKMIPILYLPELMGYAMGIDNKTLGLNLHFVDALSIFKNQPPPKPIEEVIQTEELSKTEEITETKEITV